MANNFLDLVKKKLEVSDQVHLSASDRALLEQTCKGLEEIKQQRLSEAAALTELKELVQNHPELFAEECAKLQTSFDTVSKENNKLIEYALQSAKKSQEAAERSQAAAEDAALQSATTAQKSTEETQLIQSMQKRFSSLTCLCWFSFLTTLGTLTILILNILGII
ncbi:MAG: hypothetical protein IJY09_05720 [Lachnospiraceae bacterium]|nr:hypothetical protein [Lachnospiraceae bacterium]